MILEDEKLISKMLELQKLEAEIDIVLNKYKHELKHLYYYVEINKNLGFELNSKIGILMALGYYLKSKE
jgi:hypothetical protein